MRQHANPSVGMYTTERLHSARKNFKGGTRIRARWLLPFWSEAEEYVPGTAYEVMIFQRVYAPALMKAFHGTRILDVSDPDWRGNPRVMKCLRLADAIVTSTPALAQAITVLGLETEVVCIPDRILLREHSSVKTEHNPEVKSLVWFGYHSKTKYLLPFLEEMERRGLELTVISEKRFTSPPSRKDLKVRWIRYDYPLVHEELIRHDVAFLPLPTDEAGKMASNNKTLSCWALKLPVAHTWEDLDQLQRKDTREHESEKRRMEVEQEWNAERSARQYQELLKRLHAGKDKKEATNVLLFAMLDLAERCVAQVRRIPNILKRIFP